MFSSLRFGYSDKEIAAFYMVFGGVPYYMSLMDRKQTVFQLTDPLCHFLQSVVEKNRRHDPGFWSHSQLSPLFNTWSGLAFEILCLNHVPQIKQALGISGLQTSVFSWRTCSDNAF